MHRVVVTGANGFVGRHLVDELRSRGYRVIGLDLKPCHSKNIFRADFTTPFLHEWFRKNDTVVHLAGVTTFQNANQNPVEAFRVNVGGMMNLIDACNKKKCARIVFASSGAVYKPSMERITEDHPREPPSVYGLTKKMGEDLLTYCGEQVDYTILRYGYIYGKNKTWGAVGNFIKLLNENKQPVIYGGEQVIDFVYIKDIVDGTIRAIETQFKGVTVNLSSGVGTSIEDVFYHCRNALRKDIEPIIEPARPYDWKHSVFDVFNAARYLGYCPEWSVKRGIEDMLK